MLTDLSVVNQERIKELEEVQNGYIERIHEQKSIIDEKEEKIATKNELISEKEEAISSMREDIALNEGLKKNIDTLNTEISQLNLIISSKEDDLKKQRENLEFECQKRIFAREQELNKEKASEIKLVQDQLTKEVNRYQEKYEKVLGEKDKLMSANYELKNTVDREQTNNEKKDNEIAELKKKIKQLESVTKKKSENN